MTEQDQADRREQPDTAAEEPQPHPGSTDRMTTRPDHGERTYRGRGRLSGRRALVTGADSGIGRAVAIAFAREGADVALSYLREEQDEGDEVAGLVKDAGRRAVQVPGDLTSEDQCELLVQTSVDELGGLDVLVNNAAFQMAQPGGIEAISSEQFDRTMRTNLYALFWLCRAAAPHLGAGASIVNTASVQAASPSPPLLDYATTKGGIVAFTEGLAQLLGPRGVRVNAVAPGPVWTPLIPATMPPEMVEGFGESTPLGRVGQPAELAPAYVFLASDEASFVSGEVLAVTGGKPL